MKRRVFLKLTAAATLAGSFSLSLFERLLTPLRAWADSDGQRSGRLKPERPPKVICLGLDGMDPQLLQRFVAEGALPGFARLIEQGDFKVLETSIPPQSPVAWSNFITGQDPGGHGIFDFIHRVPETLAPRLSISETREPGGFWRLGKWKFPRQGGDVQLMRHGRAFWEDLADAGVDVTIFKCPSNYPPVACRVRSLSGMGTPDILGTYGIFTYFTDRPPSDQDIGGGRIVPITFATEKFTGDILGPVNTYRDGDPDTRVAFRATRDPVHPVVKIEIGSEAFILQEGEWSNWITLHFELLPNIKEITGICRFYLMEARPQFRLYVSPVQIDPASPATSICTPQDYSRELVQRTGPFHTQGLPDDTKALDEHIFSDADYVSQADFVLAERLRQYHDELERFAGLDQGFLFFYFNSLDQNSHMFWRAMDPLSPLHAEADDRFADRIRQMYIAMDRVLGDALAVVDERTILFAISDHGFAPFYRCFHVNTWLLENGYLALKPSVRRQDVGYLAGVDWARTRAYALGINGLYLNMRGREERGIVTPGQERENLLQELVSGLEAAVDPQNGSRPVKIAYRADQVYHGVHADTGPDIVLGYRRGWRGSNESALGALTDSVFSDNLKKWSGDHCMAADEVPGIIVCNRKIAKSNPSLMDLAPTFLRLFDLQPSDQIRGSDLLAGREGA